MSTEVLQGLQIASDNTFIPDKLFTLVATKTCESLLDKSKRNVLLGNCVGALLEYRSPRDVCFDRPSRTSLKQMP